MKKMMDMALELVAMEIENTLQSKVPGRRNWVIRVETWHTNNGNSKRVITYRGGYGYAADRGLLGCFLRDIGERHIRWYKFTYKHDYMAAVAKLTESGAHDFWGDTHGLN